MSLSDRFREFTSQNYIEQAKSFLNAFWDEHSDDAENMWTWTHQFIELDIDKGKEGCDLDEFNAHRFLEKLGETRTIKEMRDEIREMDLDFNRRMALIEYLIFRYKHSVTEFVSRPQGDNKEEIEAAQAQLDEATRSMEVATQALDEANAASDYAKREAKEANRTAEEATRTAEIASQRAEEAQTAAYEARNKRDELQAAEDELRAVLDEIHSQEHARDERTQFLTARSEDPNLGVVQRNKAKNELAQHLSEDPLPLRQAKITQEAATKKAEKARVLADKAHQDAENSRVEAEQAQADALQAADEAEQAKQEAQRAKVKADKAAAQAEEARVNAERTAEDARDRASEMEQKFEEAARYLEEIRSRPGNFQGALWWIERELKEAKKFMPKRRQ